MKTELPQDSPVCFHDFSVADESIAWSSCSSAGLASSSIHGAKLTLSLESTSFRLHNVALRFGIYIKNGDHSALHSGYDTFAAEVVATCRINPEEWLDARTALLAVEVEIQSFIHIASVAAKETIAIAKKALDLVKGVADIIREYCSRIAIHIPSRTTANDSAPPKKESKRETKMKWTGTKADLYEKIYGDYLMGSFNNGKATLAELVSHHGEIYGMALTEEECYQTLRRMKGRRGKDKRPYHDHTFKIHSRTYYISEAAWRLNELMRKHEDGDGRRTRTEIKPYPGSTMI